MDIMNPYKGISNGCTVWTNIDPAVYDYLFRKVFAGEHGVKQALLNIFISALYEKCQALGIKAEWDRTSHKVIAECLHNLNFDAKPTEPEPVRQIEAEHEPPRVGADS